MSIEMDNPKTLVEKIDAAHNLVHQMNLSIMTGDKAHFKKVFEKSDQFLAEALDLCEEKGIE